MLLLFGVVSASFGLATFFFFGNVMQLSEIIAGGRLDYYLSLPRPVLLHALASGSLPSGAGDFVYGVVSFVAAFARAGTLSLDDGARRARCSPRLSFSPY